MSQFIFGYAGNKRNEYKFFKEIIKYDGIKNIIEPFCGTSAISFNIWLEHKNKFNYFLNDNSKELFNIYNIIKSDEPDNILNKINNVKNKINNKDDFLKIFKSDYDVYENIALRKLSSYRFGLYEQRRKTKKEYKFTKLQLEFFEFIKSPNVFISNDDWFNIFNKFKNNEDTIIIFDPPYLAEFNDFYENKSINIYEYIYNNNIKNFKSRIYMILENIWIIKMLFRDNNILSTFAKKYELSKKITEHIIIGNYGIEVMPVSTSIVS